MSDSTLNAAAEKVRVVTRSVDPFVSAREALDERGWRALRTELVGLFGEAGTAADGGCRLEHEYLLAVVRL